MKTPSFDVVVYQLMMEETRPSPEALLRWQALYPKYRVPLAEYFADWEMDLQLPAEIGPEAGGEDPVVDEVPVVDAGINYAMETLRRQGRLIPEDYVAALRPFDQLVLTAAQLLRGQGDAVDITVRVKEISGKDIFLSTTFAALDRLEKNGLIQWRYANPETEPENEGTQYFTATIAGERALAHAKPMPDALADFLGDFA